MSHQLYTPTTLFEGIDFSLPPEITVLEDETQNGMALTEYYFSGRDVSGSRIRGYAVLARPEGGAAAPLLAVIGDAGQRFDRAFFKYYTGRGYNVMMFDYCGEMPGVTRHTFYPEEIDYANLQKAGSHLTHAEPDARANSYFEWAALARYALTAALELSGKPSAKIGVMGVGIGANIAWMLAADKRISAFVTVFSAGVDFGEDAADILSEERQRFFAGLAPQAYAKFITAPMLFLSATNSRATPMERAMDTLSRIPADVPVLCSISPRLSSAINFRGTRNAALFLEKYVLGTGCGQELPKRFTVSAETDQDAAVLTAQPLTPDPEYVRIYYCEDEPEPSRRNWREARQVSGEKLKFELKLSPWVTTLYAYANATYASGFTVSSGLLSVKIPGGGRPVRRNALIYDAGMEFDCFTVSPDKEIMTLSGLFFEQFALAVSPGCGGINGIRALSGCLTTYKIGDPAFSGRGEDMLRFDAYSPRPQTLEVAFYGRQEPPQCYACKVELCGGALWQPVIIDKKSLKSEQSASLKDWGEVCRMVFDAPGEVLINNILWL